VLFLFALCSLLLHRTNDFGNRLRFLCRRLVLLVLWSGQHTWVLYYIITLLAEWCTTVYVNRMYRYMMSVDPHRKRLDHDPWKVSSGYRHAEGLRSVGQVQVEQELLPQDGPEQLCHRRSCAQRARQREQVAKEEKLELNTRYYTTAVQRSHIYI